MAKRVFTHSELSTYQDCPMKWWFKYDQRLDTPKPDNKLSFGRFFHDAIDVYYRTGNMIDAIIGFNNNCKDIIAIETDEERKEEIMKLDLLGVAMLNNYKNFAMANDDWKVVHSEITGKVPIKAPSGRDSTVFEYSFRTDQIIEWNDNWWIREYKTAKSIGQGYLDNLMLDEQISRYCLGCNRLFDRQISGVLYTILRKAVPRVPELLKKPPKGVEKALSQDKRIDTTYQVYMAAIEQHGLNLADYEDILALLEYKGNTFMVNEPIMRNPREIAECESRLWILCKTINTDPPIYKCPSEKCGWACQFRSLCVEDSEETRSMFIIREKYHPEVKEEGKEGKEKNDG